LSDTDESFLAVAFLQSQIYLLLQQQLQLIAHPDTALLYRLRYRRFLCRPNHRPSGILPTLIGPKPRRLSVSCRSNRPCGREQQFAPRWIWGLPQLVNLDMSNEYLDQSLLAPSNEKLAALVVLGKLVVDHRIKQASDHYVNPTSLLPAPM
jgi:hypothetical protein